MSTHPNRSLSLPSPPSTTSLASSSYHSSSSHSSFQKQTTHPRRQHHSYSSYPSTPLASFFPPPSSSSSFFPEVLSTFPDSTKLNRRRRATTGSGDVDAFGMGGFFVEGSSSSSGDARGSWGWIGAGESEDEGETEESEEESELEEEQGKPSTSISFQDVSWGRKVEEEPESPMLETTFGWAEEGEGNKGRVEVGVKEVEQEEEDEDAHSLLAYLPSPTGTFQHVEHEDGLLRSFSSTNLTLLDITQEDRRAAKELNKGTGEKVGAGAGGWRDWIGV